MRKLYLMSDIVAAVGGTLHHSSGNEQIKSVSSDTRALTPDSLFVALRGERFDAHNFLNQAVAAGASVLCVDDLEKAEQMAPGHCLWLVENTLQTFKALASWYRQLLPGQVIAVSGSVGKTSTRDMVFAALSSRKVAKTAANLNNEIGVAQTLLGTDEESESLVLELGIGEPGEMGVLAHMARPDIAMITMIGHSHLSFFGTQAALAEEKLILADALKENGLLILNADDPILLEAATGTGLQKTITEKKLQLAFISMKKVVLPEALKNAPLLQAAAISLHEDQSDFTLHWSNADALARPHAPLEKQRIHLNCYGKHMVQNALFALVTAAYLGYDPEESASNLLSYRATGARQKRLDGKNLTLIDDSYNASPEAMRAALNYLAEIGKSSGRRTIAALGCVNELGHESLRLHREIGRDIGRSRPDLAYLCGEWAEDMAQACLLEQTGVAGKMTELHCFPDRESLSEALLPVLNARDILLVKASHSYNMEKLGEAAWNLMEEQA